MSRLKTRCNIMAILCPSFKIAKYYYYAFLNFIAENEEDVCYVIDQNNYSNSITMEDDITYVFIDRHFAYIYDHMGADFIEADEFFYDIDAYYGYEQGRWLNSLGIMEELKNDKKRTS